MEHFNHNFVGWFTYPRFYSDVVKKLDNEATFVEVGVYEGKSLAYFIVEMLNSGKNFDVYAVDSFTFEGLYDKFRLNMGPVTGNFSTIFSLSWIAPQFFSDNSIDCVFIDADHVYESVKKDILAWWPKIKPGGTLSGHDICPEHPGVEKALNEIFGDRWTKTYQDELVWMITKEEE